MSKKEASETTVEDEVKLDDLPGVGDKTADKLRDAGFKNLMAIATAPVKELAEAAELGDATAVKIINAARNNLKMGYSTGLEVMEKFKTMEYITTGSTELDNLLGGKGIETQSLTEVFGKFGSGKSQLAFQLAVNVQLPKDKGGLDAHALLIDTENTFRPRRIVELAEARGLDPNEALKKIHVARAFSTDHQIILAEKISEFIEEKKVPIKVIIVDSLMSLFRSEFIGRGTLADRQQKLNKHLHMLQRMADRYNAAVFLTNQVLARPDVFFGDPTTAAGGNVLAHASTYRIYLRKSRGDKRIARLIDSPCLPDGECVFKVTGNGVED
ncbi:DNA repair and recombination protein RadA [archaeon]|nr:DNA repair and recombination protein RadA [archaeon]